MELLDYLLENYPGKSESDIKYLVQLYNNISDGIEVAESIDKLIELGFINIIYSYTCYYISSF